MLPITPSFLLAALLPGIALAQSNTTSGNDTGTKMVGWVSPAPQRSTWSIIWSCLSIFIVCSWKCVHLNIPTHEEIQGEWHTLQLCRFLPDVSIWPRRPLRRKWGRRIAWMIFIALAPEFGVALAVDQYTTASQELKKTGRNARLRGYTMAHAFYVQMGGVVTYDPPSQADMAQRYTGPTNEDASMALLEAESRETIPFNFGAKVVESLSDLDNESVVFRMPESEIRDLSKADVITKTFAILQCTWLVVQSIARRVQGLTISQLELATLAFIFCAVIMHMFWWNKPFNVETRRVLARKPATGTGLADMNVLSMDDLAKFDQNVVQERVTDWTSDIVDMIFYGELMNDSGFSLSTLSSKQSLSSYALYISTTGFLCIHLAAWNWEFGSPLIKSLWRWFNLGGLVAALLPLPVSLLIFSIDGIERIVYADIIVYTVSWMGVAGYVVSRLAVLGLTFYSLSSMPEQAYHTVDWLAWVPHFS